MQPEGEPLETFLPFLMLFFWTETIPAPTRRGGGGGGLPVVCFCCFVANGEALLKTNLWRCFCLAPPYLSSTTGREAEEGSRTSWANSSVWGRGNIASLHVWAQSDRANSQLFLFLAVQRQTEAARGAAGF